MVYFISDVHLGSPRHKNPLEVEKLLVRWLEAIAPNAEAIYLLGDIFDFWCEYRNTVPRGYVRFLGTLAKLSDKGIQIHFLVGNHDIWCLDYFEKEFGAILHRNAFEVTLNGKIFRLAHGDEEYRSHSKTENFIYCLFRNKLAQFLFRAIHPRWTIALGQNSSYKSRVKGLAKQKPTTPSLEKEWLIQWVNNHISSFTHIDYFIFGHRHLLGTYNCPNNKSITLLGDWFSHFSYATWDGQQLKLMEMVTHANPLGMPLNKQHS